MTSTCSSTTKSWIGSESLEKFLNVWEMGIEGGRERPEEPKRGRGRWKKSARWREVVEGMVAMEWKVVSDTK